MVRVDRNPRGMAPKASATSILPSKSGSTQNMAANIKVVVRVRPPNSKELELNSRFVVDVIDSRMLVFDPKEECRPFFYQGVQQPNRNFLKRANKELKFVFDHVCDQSASNQDVFETTTKDMLESLMTGYNCSVFAYGATGAGKTFTMIGTMKNPGITYLTMEHLFYSISSLEKDRDFTIAVSYIEVYNENVFDLLNPSKTPLQLREDSKYGVMVAGLTINNIETAQELLNMLENGNKNRTQHPTDANAESSRSHAVFQVYIKMKYKITGQVRMVKLSMIDLAGSERASATGCVGQRFKEGANINRSLLSLGNCINKLADGGNYIPYRDSKLTRLLKDSLGGNCKTVMIANISPSSFSFDDTYNTLKYAARANKIQLSVKKNIMDGDMRLSEYVKLTEELKKKNKELEAQLTLTRLQPVVVKPDMTKIEDWRKRIEDEEKIHATLESHLLSLMTRQRVLALRHRLKTRAFCHVAELAHRSSTEAMEQMCTEDLPRQERAAENYMKQSGNIDRQTLNAWTKWNDHRAKLQNLCDQALNECPELTDLTKLIQERSKTRQARSSSNLRHKLMLILHEEINSFTNYMTDMPKLLKKLYLTLKGYDKAPPALTNEYLDVMKKAKSVKAITWSDSETESESDPHFKFICTLDVEKPTSVPDIIIPKVETAVDIVTDSDELTDVENIDPILLSGKKRKGTPVKLSKNSTIIIDDSFDSPNSTKIINSAKKVKKELDEDNFLSKLIDPKDLNSTFVLGGKVEPLKKAGKVEVSSVVHKGLVDRTNTMQKSVNFNGKGPSSLPTARIARPVVGRALPLRRAAPPAAPAPAPRGPGFGSSLSRDGTPLARNVQDSAYKRNAHLTQMSVGCKAVRGRQRVHTHPYSRPNDRR